MKIKVWDEFIRSSQLKQKSLNVSRSVFFRVFHAVPILVEPLIYLFHALGCMKRYHLVSERWKSPAVFRRMPVTYYEHNAGRFISPDLKF